MSFQEVHQWVQKHQPCSICVEAAHIYMNEQPSEEHDFSAQIGARLYEELIADGRRVTRMLFIDNYNPDPKEFVLDVEGYITRMREHEFDLDLITYETSLDLPARNLIFALNDNMQQKDGRILLNERGILLVDHDRPTCNLLDTALYIAKLSLFELAITILPDSYKDQQKKARRVLRVLGYNHLPIINIYFNTERQITIGVQS